MLSLRIAILGHLLAGLPNLALSDHWRWATPRCARTSSNVTSTCQRLNQARMSCGLALRSVARNACGLGFAFEHVHYIAAAPLGKIMRKASSRTGKKAFCNRKFLTALDPSTDDAARRSARVGPSRSKCGYK
jgi:hypothetical protein